MPKGTSKGYQSARLVSPGGMVKPAPDFLPELPKVNRMVQKGLAQEFKAHGISVGSGGADLVVGYLLIVQNNGATTALDDYFGYGRSVDEIVDEAHKRGVLGKNPRPDSGGPRAVLQVNPAASALSDRLVFAKKGPHAGEHAGRRGERGRKNQPPRSSPPTKVFQTSKSESSRTMSAWNPGSSLPKPSSPSEHAWFHEVALTI